jgi:hypothetical protein
MKTRLLFRPDMFTVQGLTLFATLAALCLETPAYGSGKALSAAPAGTSPKPESSIPFAYKFETVGGAAVESGDGRHVVQVKDGFKLVLVPEQGGVWNMEAVSVLGVGFKNTGSSDLVMDLMLCNDGATGWSDSSLGRTIVKPGEEIPLAVALGRRNDNYNERPGYFRMSGLPNGTFGHWHTIDPARVIRLVITCNSAGDHSFELGQMAALQPMDESRMGVFPFIDKYGQYMLKDWPGKVHSDEDIRKAVAAEKKLQKELSAPTGFDPYGGWADGPRFEATGYFRTQQVDGTWWFVDPDGHLFWSFGVTCVGTEFAAQTPLGRDPAVFKDLPGEDDPEFGPFRSLREVEHDYQTIAGVPHYEFTQANLYRKYGKDWRRKSVEQDLARLQYCHLNTIGAWSDDAMVAKRKIPYTAMVHYEYAFAAQKLPDPFNPETRAGLRKALNEYPVPFKDDPWCLGAFVNNELHWHNHAFELIPDILGWKEPDTEVKKVFRDWLKEKYGAVEALNEAWKLQLSGWDDLLKGTDADLFRNADRDDCSALASLFADAFFKMVREELDHYAPRVLYFGCRFNVAPPEVIKALAKYADVISANVYSYSSAAGRYGITDKPVLISEYHFVNVGGGNLGGGLRSAQDAVQQGRQLEEYIKAAVNDPKIIGAHWFEWRDQNVGGRYDGENYACGFFDVADVPNEPLIRAAAEAGRNLYRNSK